MIHIKLSKPVVFSELRKIIDYLLLLKNLDYKTLRTEFSVTTNKNITTVVLNTTTNKISILNLEILTKYIMDLHPNFNIIDIYYYEKKQLNYDMKDYNEI